MKFHETHFDEYLTSVEECNLHPKIEKHVFSKFPNNIRDLRNVLFYGPPGVGKYSQMLKCIKKYSPSELKYEKKIIINKKYYHYGEFNIENNSSLIEFINIISKSSLKLFRKLRTNTSHMTWIFKL